MVEYGLRRDSLTSNMVTRTHGLQMRGVREPATTTALMKALKETGIVKKDRSAVAKSLSPKALFEVCGLDKCMAFNRGRRYCIFKVHLISRFLFS